MFGLFKNNSSNNESEVRPEQNPKNFKGEEKKLYKSYEKAVDSGSLKEWRESELAAYIASSGSSRRSPR
jgi:hypothetical protein